MRPWLTILLGALGVVGPAHGVLQAPSNGQIYDDAMHVTWLQDANFVVTSCTANNALWQAFDPSSVPNNSGNDKTTICNSLNGRLNWYEAEAWIDLLNANNYLGYNNWRQPATGQPDSTCSSTDGNGQGIGYRCKGSELGSLFNVSLGNPNALDSTCNNPGNGPDFCLQNKDQFSNLQPASYWSGTSYAPLPSNAWAFVMYAGFQESPPVGKVLASGYVWPVRPDQSAATVPMLPFWSLCLLGLLLAAVAKPRLPTRRFQDGHN